MVIKLILYLVCVGGVGTGRWALLLEGRVETGATFWRVTCQYVIKVLEYCGLVIPLLELFLKPRILDFHKGS